jgi:hypothetical protein
MTSNLTEALGAYPEQQEEVPVPHPFRAPSFGCWMEDIPLSRLCKENQGLFPISNRIYLFLSIWR